jgi:HK97 family phage major capsid protein
MPKPTQGMKEEARKGLDWRKEFRRGGTEIGVARARDIINGSDFGRDTIGRMVSYFARHEVDKKGKGFHQGEDGYPSAGRIAWALWGGDAGKSWAEKELSKMENTMMLDAIKEALINGQASVNLNESSALTGSGDGIGGRTIYDESFASLRMANPIRKYARQITTIGSSEAFVAKTGNATNPTNPWGYTFTPNVGTPALNTCYWQIPTKVISAQIPIRTAVLSDINNLEPSVVMDLALEFAQQEALSMVLNNDQAGSSTTTTGATYGLRGLNYYTSGINASFGSSGSALTNGLHTIKTVQTTSNLLTYNDITALASALPSQYWNFDSTCWMMHPSTIQQLRELTGGNGMPVFLEVGNANGSAVGNIFGHEVIPNPYMNEQGAGKFPVYLADWSRFVTIADREEYTLKRFEQTQAGFVTLYAEKRVVSTVWDCFAGVRLFKPLP